jgi:hypothetical protein
MSAVDTEYDDVWVELHGKRAKLIERRAELEAEMRDVANQISHLNEILRHLGPLAGLGGGENILSMGITDAVRWILNNTEGRLSPTDIRDQLIEKGYHMSALTAPMASIYKILSRLAGESDPEVIREKEDGNVFYRWKHDEEATEEDIPF